MIVDPRRVEAAEAVFAFDGARLVDAIAAADEAVGGVVAQETMDALAALFARETQRWRTLHEQTIVERDIAQQTVDALAEAIKQARAEMDYGNYATAYETLGSAPAACHATTSQRPTNASSRPPTPEHGETDQNTTRRAV